MLDTFNLPDKNCTVRRQLFYANAATGSTSYQTWIKPVNVKFIHCVVIGGGSGGGSGVGAGLATARRGGGGGASSAITTALFSANQIPDILYVKVGQGGEGGIGLTTNASGNAGTLSYVSIIPDSANTATNILLQSGAVAATGGASGSSGGVGGTAGTVWGGSIFNELGLVSLFAGQNGGNGQTTSASPNIGISGITTGGAPGAGTNGATPQTGGNITGAGFINTISGGTTSGETGSSGYMTTIPSTNSSARQPMLFTGGAGGASSNSSNGGNGGYGTYGSGGGGGGAGLTNLGGSGGKGGDGLVIITSW